MHVNSIHLGKDVALEMRQLKDPYLLRLHHHLLPFDVGLSEHKGLKLIGLNGNVWQKKSDIPGLCTFPPTSASSLSFQAGDEAQLPDG